MQRLNIALVAHDQRKPDLLEWVSQHVKILAPHKLFATGTTGKLIGRETGLEITPLQSGPLGGDQELGALISKGQIDALFFFWDPMNPQPHEPDVRALIRISVLHNIIIVEDTYTADMVISSPLFASKEYVPKKRNWSAYLTRSL